MSNTEYDSRPLVENEILDEVHAVREALSARFEYDVHKLGEYLRSRRKELEEQGFRFVSKEDLEKR
ncbi:MAG: hypothetical protein FWC50_01780, partial [Planctomycetaceae bacterium]|nr:hypothetical protein [Planctomycetaceae bacterium]